MGIAMDLVNHDSVSLDISSLSAFARRLAGTKSEEPFQFLDGLEHLTSALDSEAQLTNAGRVKARSALAKALATQIQVRRLLAAQPGTAQPSTAQPGILQNDIQPIFITGLLRTGTTFLQQLLSLHPALRSPQLWELMAPAAPESSSQLIASAKSYVDEYYQAAPEFRAIHPLDARQPEECHRLTANSFRHFIYALRYHVPSYVTWLRAQSMVPAYEFHRAQLQCLLGRRPGNPVVLKCPSHLWHLDALRQVYPNAKVIRLHRRPSVSVPSVASLTAVVRAARSDHVDHKEIGAYWLDEATRALTGLRRGTDLDIRFSDLIADPLRVVAQVCDFAGVPMVGQGAMSELIKAQTKTEHHYRPEDFGLSVKTIDERFADYHREYGL